MILSKVGSGDGSADLSSHSIFEPAYSTGTPSVGVVLFFRESARTASALLFGWSPRLVRRRSSFRATVLSDPSSVDFTWI